MHGPGDAGCGLVKALAIVLCCAVPELGTIKTDGSDGW